MTLKRTLVTAIALAGALVAPATAAAVPAGTTALIDRPSGFGGLPFDGANQSQGGAHSVSADGRYVVFDSLADGILDSDDDNSVNTYRLDRQRGVVEQVNTTADGTALPGSVSFFSSISADGRYVAFSEFGAPLFPGAPAGGVVVKDMMTGKIELASRANGAAGAPASSDGFPAGIISGDGRHVAFTAFGVFDGANVDGKAGQVNAYVRDLDTSVTRLVSVKSDGTAGGGVSVPPVPDFDGNTVAFISDEKLAPGDTDTNDDAYMRVDIGTAGEETCFLSFNIGQTPGADAASQVDVAGNGTDVAWSDESGVFFAQENNVAVGTATRVDVKMPGGDDPTDGQRPSFEPVTTADAQSKRLYFVTSAGLAQDDTNRGDDVYDAEVNSVGNPAHQRLDTSGRVDQEVSSVSGAKDGAIVVYTSESDGLPGGSANFQQVYQRVNGVDRNISQPPGRAPRVDDAGSSFVDSSRSVSDDGGKIVFQTHAPALGGSDDEDQITVRNVVSGATSLLSAEPDGTPANNGADEPTIDAAGDRVAFISSSSGLLVTGNPNGGTHVYVRDLTTGELALVDRRTDGKPIDGGVDHAVIAPDGRHLVYTSSAKDAPGAPPANTTLHAYVVDLQSGNTTLADKTASGTIGNGHVRAIDVNGDGSVVAFTSEATNLGVAGSASHQQLYVANPGAHTLEWASVPEDGDPSHVDAGGPSLSRSGTRVAFNQDATGFGHGMSGESQVFMRDLAQGTTMLASRLPGGAAASNRGASLSADGKRVAFNSSVGDDQATLEFAPALAAAPAAAGDAALPPSGIYLRDLDQQEPTFVSGTLDPSRSDETGSSIGVSIDGTGSCVAFDSQFGAPLSDPSYGPDFSHVYMRAVDDDCPGTAAHPEPPADTPPGANPPSGGGPAPGTTPHDNGGLPPVDKTAPAISSAKLTARTFAVGRASTVRSARTAVGTTFTFSLSEPAATSIAISQRTTGRKKGTRCVAPRPGLKKRCTRIVDVVTLQRAKTVKGLNRVAFTGKVGKTALKPGSYQAVLTARDKAGNVSKPVKLTFTVVKR